jgi:hypothetical protein
MDLGTMVVAPHAIIEVGAAAFILLSILAAALNGSVRHAAISAWRSIKPRPGPYRSVIIVGLIILACLVALSFIGTSPPGLHYYPGGSAIQ